MGQGRERQGRVILKRARGFRLGPSPYLPPPPELPMLASILHVSKPTALALGVLGLAALAGCKTPQGNVGGRMDPYRTTYSDVASNQASMPDLYQFSDQTAAELAQQLAQIPEIEDSPSKVVLELGDILNKTDTSTQDFELIQRRLRSKLLTTRVLRDRVMFVEGRQRMDREMERIQGTDDADLLQEGTRGGGTDRYPSRQTYLLQGDFLESVRGGVRRYFFNFKLTNLASREIVFDQYMDSAMTGPRG